MLADAAATQHRTEPQKKTASTEAGEKKSGEKDGPCSTLRDLLTRQGAGVKPAPTGNRPNTMSLDDIIQVSAGVTCCLTWSIYCTKGF